MNIKKSNFQPFPGDSVKRILRIIVREKHAKLQKPQRKGVGRITSY